MQGTRACKAKAFVSQASEGRECVVDDGREFIRVKREFVEMREVVKWVGVKEFELVVEDGLVVREL